MTRFTTLLGGLFIALGLSSCSVGTGQTDQKVACYDTGSGVKCVPITALPAGATPICEDDDGSSESIDNDDDGGTANVLPDDGDDGDDDDADECGHAGDSGSDSSDGMDGTSASSDTDGDGVPDGDDCDCVPPPPPPGGGDTGGTPVPRALRLGHAAHAAMSPLTVTSAR